MDVQEAVLLEDGTLDLDRKWCVVDSRGDRYPALQSLSQRLCPVLASISVTVVERGTHENIGGPCLCLHAPGMPTLSVRIKTEETEEEERMGGVKKTAVAEAARPPGSRVQVECGGASTTSAGSWHLGVLGGLDEGAEASNWLSTYLNSVDKAKVVDDNRPQINASSS